MQTFLPFRLKNIWVLHTREGSIPWTSPNYLPYATVLKATTLKIRGGLGDWSFPYTPGAFLDLKQLSRGSSSVSFFNFTSQLASIPRQISIKLGILFQGTLKPVASRHKCGDTLLRKKQLSVAFRWIVFQYKRICYIKYSVFIWTIFAQKKNRLQGNSTWVRFLKIHEASPVHKTFPGKANIWVQATIQTRQDKATGRDPHHIGSNGESNTKAVWFVGLWGQGLSHSIHLLEVLPYYNRFHNMYWFLWWKCLDCLDWNGFFGV
jgi:hypothetical protein